MQPEYSAEVRGWLSEYEKKYGKRGVSSMTTEKVPLSWTCGEARVIDVRSLIGTTKRQQWPMSPEITVEHIKVATKPRTGHRMRAKWSSSTRDTTINS